MLRIGTRGSKLALWQAEFVRSEILKHSPGSDIELSVIKTQGDKILDSPLSELGGKGVFVKEIENSLLRGDIDIAVHSLKDLPSELPEGLMLGAYTNRQDAEDALISKDGAKLKDLPPGSKVGTGSLRRKALILHHCPYLEIIPIRGNVDTRLSKLESEGMDALILAAAGLRRMGFFDKITEVLDPLVFIPAPGQGVIAVECREDDNKTLNTINDIGSFKSQSEAAVERSFLKAIGGDCNIPAGCYAKHSGENIYATAFISDHEGSRFLKSEVSGHKDSPLEVGMSIAEEIFKKGGKDLIERIKNR